MHDTDFFLLHYYVQKGFSLEYLTNLKYSENLFLKISMEMEIERQNSIMQSMSF